MHRAVVELDPLADADGAAADDERLVLRQGRCLVLLVVGAVEVGRLRLELSGAGVDHLVDGADAPPLAQVAHLLGEAVGQGADDDIGEPLKLRLAEEMWGEAFGQQAPLHAHH